MVKRHGSDREGIQATGRIVVPFSVKKKEKKQYLGDLSTLILDTLVFGEYGIISRNIYSYNK